MDFFDYPLTVPSIERLLLPSSLTRALRPGMTFLETSVVSLPSKNREVTMNIDFCSRDITPIKLKKQNTPRWLGSHPTGRTHNGGPEKERR